MPRSTTRCLYCHVSDSCKSPYRYYVLIAACVLARRAEWIKNACLAAALLFPAVAAVHGIVLAALHRDGKGKTQSAIQLDASG